MIKVKYNCDVCRSGCSVLIEFGESYTLSCPPTHCIYEEKGNKAKWELVPLGPFPSLHEEAKQKAPNCALCRWLRLENTEPGDERLIYDICTAQGGHDCDDVYNNTECQALYSKKDAVQGLTDLFMEVFNAARVGKIPAIKKFRELTGQGLKESKEAVEALFTFNK